MICATVEFSHGARIHLGSDRRWTGDDPVIVDCANLHVVKGGYHPNWALGLATEVAEELGGRIIYVIPNDDSELPPGGLW